MLLNTGTQLTWHCGQRHLIHQHGTNWDVATVVGARVDTWKPKHMVGMALKTAVQEVELEQTSIRRVKDAVPST